MALEVTGPCRCPPPDPAWLDRRREDALAAELPILDPHHHLWEQARLPYRAEDFAPVGMAVNRHGGEGATWPRRAGLHSAG